MIQMLRDFILIFLTSLATLCINPTLSATISNNQFQTEKEKELAAHREARRTREVIYESCTRSCQEGCLK